MRYDEFPELEDGKVADPEIQPFTFRKIGKNTYLYLPENFLEAYSSPLVSMIAHFISVDTLYKV